MKPAERLALFKTRAEELTCTRLITKGFNPGITIKWKRMQGLRFESREPDEEDLRSFLLTFRQFVSDAEPIFLNRVYNVCEQCLTSDELKGYLHESREEWRKAFTGAGIKLVYNEKEVTPEYVMDLWINGHYFHSDPEKASALRRLLPDEKLLTRHRFLDLLVDATRQVLYVGHVITVALREGLVKS